MAFSAQLAVPNSDPVNESATTLLLTNNPASDIDAEKLPDDICDKLRPTIPDAGIPNRLAPEPLNEPLNCPINEPVLYELLNDIKLEDSKAILELLSRIRVSNDALS